MRRRQWIPCRKPMTLDLPISAADLARVTVPHDMTAHEAKKLAAMILTMGLPHHNPYPLVLAGSGEGRNGE